MKPLETMFCSTCLRKHMKKQRHFLIDSGTLASRLISFQTLSTWSTWSSCSTETTLSKAEWFLSSTTTLCSTDDQYSSSTASKSSSTNRLLESTLANHSSWRRKLMKHVIYKETSTWTLQRSLKLGPHTTYTTKNSKTLSRRSPSKETRSQPS